jgi:hypothetical protein
VADPRRFDWLFRPRERDEDMPLSAEARFAEAFAELPSDERSALALRDLGGLDADEIAVRLGTDADAAEQLVSRARESLRAALRARGRRVLEGLLPLQSWLESSAGPAVRAAGAVVAAAAGIGATVDAGPIAASAPLEPARGAGEMRAPGIDPVAPPAAAAAVPPPARSAPAASAIERAAPLAESRPAAVLPPAAAAGSSLPRADASAEPSPPPPVPGTPPADPATASAGQVDRAPGLRLVRVVAVPRRQIRPDDVRRTVLHLPDVAELVRDEVVGRVAPPEQDRPDEHVAVVAPQAGEAEEPGRDDHADAVDLHGPLVQPESVEARLGAEDPGVRTPLQTGE